MTTTSVSLVHWMPIEHFPPAMNLARYFATRPDFSIDVFTTSDGRPQRLQGEGTLSVTRAKFPTGKSTIAKVRNYLLFPLLGLRFLLLHKPDVIIYMEPHSALPVFLYSIIKRRVNIVIHHHEYHQPADYKKKGMHLARIGSLLETRYLFAHASRISQTNSMRRALMLADFPRIASEKVTTQPNYPPQSWSNTTNSAWQQFPNNDATRTVYVGALSRATTYIAELLKWIEQQSSFTLDVYSHNNTNDVKALFESTNCPRIRFFPQGADYDSLPGILANYHVGWILYKGITPNYQFNASNKLFEYLVCGLDVIYPVEMNGVHPYSSSTVQPRVIGIDFQDLHDFKYTKVGRNTLTRRQEEFKAENVYGLLADDILGDAAGRQLPH